MPKPTSVNTLAASDRVHLAKLLGLLDSDHAGERDNAACAAHRLVQQHGITWFDVVTHPLPTRTRALIRSVATGAEPRPHAADTASGQSLGGRIP